MRPLLLTLILVLPLAACGGGDDFGTRVDKSSADLEKGYSARGAEAIVDDIDAGHGDAAATDMESKAKLLDKAANELPTDGVPDMAKHALALTVDGLHKRAANLRQAARAARGGDLRGADKILKSYADSPADRELTKGFDLLAALA